MTREESLKILRDVHDKALFSVRNALETLIPELVESEDEKIMKWIKKELESKYVVDNRVNNTMADKAFAYLEKQKEQKSPLTDEAFKEQLERVLRDNVLDTDIRITGDTVIGVKINPEDKGLLLRSLSDEAILKECKERGLDVKYSEEKNLVYRMNWVMQDYYKAGKDEEEREHRFKCYKLFWDALADSEFFNRLESHKEELTKLQEKCKKFVEKQKDFRKLYEDIAKSEWFKKAYHGKSLGSDDEQKEQNPKEVDESTKRLNDNWMKQHFDDYEEQKPAEWSDEDADILNCCISSIEEAKENRYAYKETDGDTSYDREIDWLKSLRPQQKQKRQIKEGDKVHIHCRKDRKEGIISIYDGKVGEVIYIWDAKRNPWGHIGVRLDNGCNDGFYEDELEVIDESSWKPSEEQMEALYIASYAANSTPESLLALTELYEQLKNLM